MHPSLRQLRLARPLFYSQIVSANRGLRGQAGAIVKLLPKRICL